MKDQSEPRYPQVHVAGFTAYLDAYALQKEVDWSGHHHAELHLLSFVGPRESTRAVWANLAKGGKVLVKSSGFNGYAYFPHGKYGTSYRAPARNGLHYIAVSSGVLSHNTLIARSPERLLQLVQRQLDLTLHFPLHPLWLDWFLEQLEEEGLYHALDTFGGVYAAILSSEAIAQRSERLFETLREALESKVLPIPDPEIKEVV